MTYVQAGLPFDECVLLVRWQLGLCILVPLNQIIGQLLTIEFHKSCSGDEAILLLLFTRVLLEDLDANRRLRPHPFACQPV